MRSRTWILSAARYSLTSAPGIVSMLRNDFASGEPSGLRAPRRISIAGGLARRSPETVFAGRVNVSCTASPVCCAARSVMGTGTGGEGGVGSPGAPQPVARRNSRSEIRNSKSETRRRRIQSASGFREIRFSIYVFQILQDVAAQVLVLDNVGELLVHVGGVDLNIFLLEVGGFEGELVENFFEDGMQAAGANVFGLLIDNGRELGDGVDGVVGDVQLYAFGFEQRDVLLDQSILGFGEDADEIFFL